MHTGHQKTGRNSSRGRRRRRFFVLKRSLDGMLAAVVPDASELHQARATDKDVDCCEGVVDRGDDKGVSVARPASVWLVQRRARK